MHEVKSVQDLLDQIEKDEILLPEFQRGYVWTRDQVRGLMQSLYRKHPSGHLLVWSTYRPSVARAGGTSTAGHSLLLLDGQQRLTTLFVLFRGRAPRFYEGESLFFDLYFNIQTEEFRFWQKSLMAKNPAWLSVHDFLRDGLSALLEQLDQYPEDHRAILQSNLARLSKLDSVRNYTYTVDKVSGDDFEVAEVVEIFNRINKAGTPLTKADLALAHICSIWPDARAEMRRFRDKMRGDGFAVDFDFLVRCLAGAASGSILLDGSFRRMPAADLRTAWMKLQPAFERVVHLLRRALFVDNLNDLPSVYPLVVLTLFLARRSGRFPTPLVERRFIRWLCLASLWSRYSGATETKLQQDVALVSGDDTDPTFELETAILRHRGRIEIEASDLEGASVYSAVGLLSQIVARARDARDWFTGAPLYDQEMGRSNGTERHYVFPRAVLKSAGLQSSDRKIINEIANRAFLVQRAPAPYRAAPPCQYLPGVHDARPGVLDSQSLPLNPTLWDPANYHDFLAARRRSLASAINDFIRSWLPTDVPITDEQQVRNLMTEGESATTEFKSTLRWDRDRSGVNKDLEHVVVKTLAGFLNASGGTLLLGVDDEGRAIGIEDDYSTLRSHNRDGFERRLRELVEQFLGATIAAELTVTFHEIDGSDICQVTVDPSDDDVWVVHGKESIFYLRIGPATKPLSVKDAVDYVKKRWKL